MTKSSKQLDREINSALVTDKQIKALRTEAAQAGDHAQALICDIATGAVDPDDGYDHLRIWSFLSKADQRKIAKLDTDAARAVCAEAIEAGQG
jgi:hypothetical protein